jgi:hypothetical protein
MQSVMIMPAQDMDSMSCTTASTRALIGELKLRNRQLIVTILVASMFLCYDIQLV